MTPTGNRMVMVVPTYNEAENLEWIIARTLAAVPETDVLVVDDGSPDGTGRIADDHRRPGSRRSRWSTARRRRAWGRRTSTVSPSHSTAGYELIGEMDADGSHQPEQLHLLVEAVDEADLVIGSRWVRGGRVVNWSLFRKALSLGRQPLRPPLLGIPVRDLTAGFRLFRAEDPPTDRPRGRRVGGLLLPDRPDPAHDPCRAAGPGGADRVPERERGQSKMDRSVATESLRRITVWGLEERRVADPGGAPGTATGGLMRCVVDCGGCWRCSSWCCRWSRSTSWSSSARSSAPGGRSCVVIVVGVAGTYLMKREGSRALAGAARGAEPRVGCRATSSPTARWCSSAGRCCSLRGSSPTWPASSACCRSPARWPDARSPEPSPAGWSPSPARAVPGRPGRSGTTKPRT